MSDQNRFGAERYDRDRRDDYRTQDYRDYGPERGYGARSYGGDRGGQSAGFGAYGAGSYGSNPYEERSFNGQGGYNPYGEEAYRDRQYGSQSGSNYSQGGGYGAGRYTQGAYGDYGRSDYDRSGYDQRYSDRQASGAMLHQGYRAPFGADRSGFDRNEFRPYDGEGQRYQYNNYQPTHDQPGRYAQAGSRYGYGMDSLSGSQQDRGFWDQTRDEVSSWFGDDDAARRRRMDEMRANRNGGEHHGGKGPKGYTRSDDRIREDVNDRLTADHHLDASDIEAKVDNGEVTLSGHVATRNEKRHAEDIAERIGGVKHVQNNLRVKETSASSYSATGGAAQTATPTTSGTTASSSAASRSN